MTETPAGQTALILLLPIILSAYYTFTLTQKSTRPMAYTGCPMRNSTGKNKEEILYKYRSENASFLNYGLQKISPRFLLQGYNCAQLKFLEHTLKGKFDCFIWFWPE